MCRFTDIQHFGGEGVKPVVSRGRSRGGVIARCENFGKSQGVKVSRLKRVRFGPLFIPSTITKGRFQELPRKDLDKLLKSRLPARRKT